MVLALDEAVKETEEQMHYNKIKITRHSFKIDLVIPHRDMLLHTTRKQPKKHTNHMACGALRPWGSMDT